MLYTDGGSRDDGRAAAAAMLVADGQKVRVACLLKDKTPVEAEVLALCLGLRLIKGSFPERRDLKLNWFSDAETVVFQVNRASSNNSSPVWELLFNLLEGVDISGTHSVVKEIDRCHGACDWLIEKGEELIEKGAGQWKVVDWRLDVLAAEPEALPI